MCNRGIANGCSAPVKGKCDPQTKGSKKWIVNGPEHGFHVLAPKPHQRAKNKGQNDARESIDRFLGPIFSGWSESFQGLNGRIGLWSSGMQLFGSCVSLILAIAPRMNLSCILPNG